MAGNFEIRQYGNADYDQVIELWRREFPNALAHNDPQKVLKEKLENDDNLLFVADNSAQIGGTVMAGYDGHRGWLYSVVVHPSSRRQGLGRKLVTYAMARLAALGCCKVNLQIRSESSDVASFYRRLGFETEDRVSMGTLLIDSR
ncbi:MAG: ribosomal protein S18 acetylase RimI-like enzyme [Parasphingorhabdus sp.]|jgi:ribosomal protein S18 acetylase RimI-like enzyme